MNQCKEIKDARLNEEGLVARRAAPRRGRRRQRRTSACPACVWWIACVRWRWHPSTDASKCGCRTDEVINVHNAPLPVDLSVDHRRGRSTKFRRPAPGCSVADLLMPHSTPVDIDVKGARLLGANALQFASRHFAGSRYIVPCPAAWQAYCLHRSPKRYQQCFCPLCCPEEHLSSGTCLPRVRDSMHAPCPTLETVSVQSLNFTAVFIDAPDARSLRDKSLVLGAPSEAIERDSRVGCSGARL